MRFHYVYILQNDHGQFYVGSTKDLKARLKKHNAGEVTHTSKFRPWKIKTAIAFAFEERAREFERYILKLRPGGLSQKSAYDSLGAAAKAGRHRGNGRPRATSTHAINRLNRRTSILV